MGEREEVEASGALDQFEPLKVLKTKHFILPHLDDVTRIPVCGKLVYCGLVTTKPHRVTCPECLDNLHELRKVETYLEARDIVRRSNFDQATEFELAAFKTSTEEGRFTDSILGDSKEEFWWAMRKVI